MPDSRFCSQCGALLPEDSLFCEKCGRSFEAASLEPQRRATGERPSVPPTRRPLSAPDVLTSPPMRSRKRVLIALWACVAVALVIAAYVLTAPGTSSLSSTYTSPTGFSIKYPSNWAKTEPQSGSVYVSFALPTQNGAENLNVLVNTSGNRSLANVTDGIIADLKRNYPDFTPVQQGTYQLGGYPAYAIVYTTFTNTGGNMKIMEVWAVKDGYLYALTYKATANTYDKYLGTAQKMIDSFQFTQRSLSFEARPTHEAKR